MGLIGGSQSAYKQNQELGNRKKSMQERTKGYETKSSSKFQHREMSDEQRQEHLLRLQQRKRADTIRTIILFSILGLVVLVGIIAFKIFLS